MKYTLKDDSEIESIPIGKAKMTIGEKRNRLTLCDRGPTPPSKKTKVICKCECGKYIYINLQDFMSGKVQSCGCLKKEKLSENNNGFSAKDYSLPENNINPFYEYISPSKIKWEWSHQIVWNIRCRKCKKEYLGIPTELVTLGKRGMNPCECWRKESIGIKTIKHLLNSNKISFEQEKTFLNCVSPKGRPYKFDFFLPDYNILIEYDGEQHFEPRFEPSLERAEEKLLLQQEYDKIKNEWCKNNNILLIRISYKEIEKIKINDLLLDSKYIIGGNND